MGQAKLKGNFEQRQAQAIAAARAKFPATVACNNCKHELSDILPMDVRNMPGMRLAGGAVCPECSQTTWILDGTPEALATIQQAMAEESGAEAKVGFAQRPAQTA